MILFKNSIKYKSLLFKLINVKHPFQENTEILQNTTRTTDEERWEWRAMEPAYAKIKNNLLKQSYSKLPIYTLLISISRLLSSLFPNKLTHHLRWWSFTFYDTHTTSLLYLSPTPFRNVSQSELWVHWFSSLICL